jgi:hypothetical protein
MSDQELVEIPQNEIRVARKPEEVLREAKEAAQALMSVVALKKDPVVFNGNQYLEFEDWQTVAKFYGLTSKVTSTTFIDYGGVKGFEAHAEVIRGDGQVVSSADAMCLNDEDNWSTRAKYEWKTAESGRKVKSKIADVPVPLFQLRSMAQTRACAKALRNVLAWVVVLAGFKPNVAEEMTGDEPTRAPANRPQPKKEAMDIAGFKEITAKFAGSCSGCSGMVQVGDKVMFNSKLKGVYHPACLAPKPEITAPAAITPAVIKNLEKMAEAAGMKLIDRIGADGLQELEQISPAYAKELLEEFAKIMDGRNEK